MSFKLKKINKKNIEKKLLYNELYSRDTFFFTFQQFRLLIVELNNTTLQYKPISGALGGQSQLTNTHSPYSIPRCYSKTFLLCPEFNNFCYLWTWQAILSYEELVSFTEFWNVSRQNLFQTVTRSSNYQQKKNHTSFRNV